MKADEGGWAWWVARGWFVAARELFHNPFGSSEACRRTCIPSASRFSLLWHVLTKASIWVSRWCSALLMAGGRGHAYPTRSRENIRQRRSVARASLPATSGHRRNAGYGTLQQEGGGQERSRKGGTVCSPAHSGRVYRVDPQVYLKEECVLPYL